MAHTPIPALAAHLAFTGIMAGVGSMLLMARRGLVSPEEVEEYLDSLTSHIKPLPDDSEEAARQTLVLASEIEAHFAPLFAQLRNEVWRSPQDPSR